MPVIFQIIMAYKLNEFLHKGYLVYMDDIFVYEKPIDQHNGVLLRVLKILNEKDIKINDKNLQIGRKQIRFLKMIGNRITACMLV